MSDIHPTPSRRQFLVLAGLAAPSALAAAAEVKRFGQVANGTDNPQDLVASKADLGSLFPEVQKLAEARRPPWSFRDDRFRSFGEFQAAAREKICELLLYRPEKVDPRPDVLERTDCGSYIREKIVFSTSPVFRVPAYVLIPKGLTRPAPAIVDLHSHGGMFLFGKEKVVDLGKNHPAMTSYHERNYDGQPTATALVRRGYVVITIDALMFGERRTLLDVDLRYGWDRAAYSAGDVQHLNQQCRAKEATLVKALTFAGVTWPGIVFWDDLRTVDYLVSRPEVDSKRIGCLGVSMGGYRAIFLSALDERIKAGCIVGFMSTVSSMIQAHVDTHSWVHFLPSLHLFMDWPDVASLAAPRSLMVLQCSQDRLFPLAGMKAAVEKIGTAFDRARAKEKFLGRFYDVPHQFTKLMQEEAFVWLDRQLGK